jgi:integrase
MAAHLAESTQIKKLRHIEDLYRHADQCFGQASLDNALGTFDDDVLGSILESWFVTIRNQPATTEADQKRWDAGVGFVSSVSGWISKNDANRRLQNIEARLHRLSSLYRQFHVHRRKSVERIRSLPASTVEALYQIVDPESQLNPFSRERTRWRVYVAFILMLHQGLRRGEVLLLPADTVKSGFRPKGR